MSRRFKVKHKNLNIQWDILPKDQCSLVPEAHCRKNEDRMRLLETFPSEFDHFTVGYLNLNLLVLVISSWLESFDWPTSARNALNDIFLFIKCSVHFNSCIYSIRRGLYLYIFAQLLRLYKTSCCRQGNIGWNLSPSRMSWLNITYKIWNLVIRFGLPIKWLS